MFGGHIGMRYLKYFESKRISDSDEIFYKEISNEEFLEYSDNDRFIYFDEYRKIENFIKSITDNELYNKYDTLILSMSKYNLIDITIVHDFEKDGRTIGKMHFYACIWKLTDEWYIVYKEDDYEEDIYYKCDQLEGLFKCLEDIL